MIGWRLCGRKMVGSGRGCFRDWSCCQVALGEVVLFCWINDEGRADER
jgi:hypothetical protein